MFEWKNYNSIYGGGYDIINMCIFRIIAKKIL